MPGRILCSDSEAEDRGFIGHLAAGLFACCLRDLGVDLLEKEFLFLQLLDEILESFVLVPNPPLQRFRVELVELIDALGLVLGEGDTRGEQQGDKEMADHVPFLMSSLPWAQLPP
jgi:hypothetical protein